MKEFMVDMLVSVIVDAEREEDAFEAAAALFEDADSIILREITEIETGLS